MPKGGGVAWRGRIGKQPQQQLQQTQQPQNISIQMLAALGGSKWRQGRRGGRGWRTYFTSAGDRKNANAQANEGEGVGSEEWGPTWQANYKCNHEINLINPGTKNAEQMFVETALRH